MLATTTKIGGYCIIEVSFVGDGFKRTTERSWRGAVFPPQLSPPPHPPHRSDQRPHTRLTHHHWHWRSRQPFHTFHRQRAIGWVDRAGEFIRVRARLALQLAAPSPEQHRGSRRWLGRGLSPEVVFHLWDSVSNVYKLSRMF